MALSNGAKAVIAIIVAAAVAVCAFTLIDNVEDESDTVHTVTLSINNPNAGTLYSQGGQVLHGNSFTCSVTQKTAGYTFDGWYSENTQMSNQQTYTFTVNSSIALEARYSIIHDASFTITPTVATSPATLTMVSTYNVEISQRNWTVTDVLSGEKLVNTSAYGNAYDSYNISITKGRVLSVTQSITYSDGQKATSNTVKVVDETITKTFSWRYQKDTWYSIITDILGINDGSAKWDVRMSLSWYYAAVSSSLPRTADEGGFDSIRSYVTHNDSVIRTLAQGFTNYTSGMSDSDRVNWVLKFVQSLPYQYDIIGKGKDEYWNMPAETLWEGKGDCEDHAFLFASILKAMGYKVVLHHVYCYEYGVLVAAHLATGVAVPGGSGSYTTVNGEKYYYCEATAEVGKSWFNDANVGFQPDGFVIIQTWSV